MGRPGGIKFVIVTVCLLVTGLLVNFRTGSVLVEKDVTLGETIETFGDWQPSAEIPLQSSVRDVLKLDDYLFRSFTDGSERVTLYIGYYFTNRKVGASHDPLVCFPGQGWTLENRKKGEITVPMGKGTRTLDYATMIAERNGNKEFLLYWFQAYDRPTSDTLSQKAMLLWRKILTGGEESAFVRISMDMNGKTKEECLGVLTSFARDFYPVFTQYINPTVLKEVER